MSSANSSPFYTAPNRLDGPGTALMRNLGSCVLAATLLCWVLTQYVASRLGYQAALGDPLLNIAGWKLYTPMEWLGWYARWHAVAAPAARGAFHLATRVSQFGALAVVILFMYCSRQYRQQIRKQSENIHGSAHWASPAEVRQSGLLGGGAGVYVGAWNDPRKHRTRYLRHDGPEHILAFAPTRSGKGVGLVLPTLLSWPHSAVVYDIKGENWALTSGWRQREADNHVVKFEPSAANGSSARFNPLEEVRLRTDRETADVQNIMTMIVDPDGKGLKDHWQKSSQALLVGVALHVLYAEPVKTLNGIVAFLSNPARTATETMKFMLDTDHDLFGPGWPNPDGSPNYCHPVVAAAARDMLNKAGEELSGVLSTAISFLTLYRDPVVARNTSACDFRIRDLMNRDKPVSLYLVVPPSDKDRLRPLIRLLLNQIVRGLTESMEFEDGRSVAGYRHRLLLMLDEFPSLGKLDIFEESLAFIAGYGLKAYLIIQDMSQLWTAYGRDESIFSNCHVRVAYAPNKIETAELLSKMAGTATIVKRSNTFNGTLTGSRPSFSTSTQETQRPLVTADEVMRLPAARKDAKGRVIEAGDMLIFMAGQAPIYGKQILYFMDPTFSVRARIPAPPTSDVLEAETGQVQEWPPPFEWGAEGGDTSPTGEASPPGEASAAGAASAAGEVGAASAPGEATAASEASQLSEVKQAGAVGQEPGLQELALDLRAII
jgi:type IV secretion system protein VirD4